MRKQLRGRWRSNVCTICKKSFEWFDYYGNPIPKTCSEECRTEQHRSLRIGKNNSCIEELTEDEIARRAKVIRELNEKNKRLGLPRRVKPEQLDWLMA